MSRLSLSKSSLSKQSRQLKTFERFLPSLDLKRKQLMAERGKAIQGQRNTEVAMAELRQRIAERLPMLANRDVSLHNLVKLKAVRLEQENVMGTRLPRFSEIEVEVSDYGYMIKPHWVDRLVDDLSRMLELNARLAVEKQRTTLLDEAVRKVTQRVNLFEKVLIPKTRGNIKKIKIYLSDAERAAVVRSKIAKGKRAREGLA